MPTAPVSALADQLVLFVARDGDLFLYGASERLTSTWPMTSPVSLIGALLATLVVEYSTNVSALAEHASGQMVSAEQFFHPRRAAAAVIEQAATIEDDDRVDIGPFGQAVRRCSRCCRPEEDKRHSPGSRPAYRQVVGPPFVLAQQGLHPWILRRLPAGCRRLQRTRSTTRRTGCRPWPAAKPAAPAHSGCEAAGGSLVLLPGLPPYPAGRLQPSPLSPTSDRNAKPWKYAFNAALPSGVSCICAKPMSQAFFHVRVQCLADHHQ